MKKKALALCLLVVLVAPMMLLIQANLVLPDVKAQIHVNGIISYDTKWTKTNTILGLLAIEPTNTQTGVTQPVIPQFDAFLDTYPNYIPPTYGVDPSTGKAVITKEGYEVIYKWADVRVYGQPFWEYDNSVGQRVSLFYNVRWQSNLDTTWQTFPNEVSYFQDSMDPWDTQGDGYLISIGFKGIDNDGIGVQLIDPEATEISFQVEALIGYYNSNNVFVGQSSGWSDTQAITLSDVSASPTPTPITSPSPTPTVPEFSSWTIMLTLSIMVAIAGLLVYFKKRKHAKLTVSAKNM